MHVTATECALPPKEGHFPGFVLSEGFLCLRICVRAPRHAGPVPPQMSCDHWLCARARFLVRGTDPSVVRFLELCVIWPLLPGPKDFPDIFVNLLDHFLSLVLGLHFVCARLGYFVCLLLLFLRMCS